MSDIANFKTFFGDKNERTCALVAGLLTDLAIGFIFIGWYLDIPALLLIGGGGFFLACSPAFIAAPLAPLFGLYVALVPLIIMIGWLLERRKLKKDRGELETYKRMVG